MTSLAKVTKSQIDDVVEFLGHMSEDQQKAACEYFNKQMGNTVISDLAEGLENLKVKAEVVVPKALPASPKWTSPKPQKKLGKKDMTRLKSANFNVVDLAKWTSGMHAKKLGKRKGGEKVDYFRSLYDAEQVKQYYEGKLTGLDNPTGFDTWFYSAYIHGIRFQWNGQELLRSSNEEPFNSADFADAPAFPSNFTENFPKNVALDGIFDINSINTTGKWKFIIFDIPSSTLDFELNYLKLQDAASGSEYLDYQQQFLVGKKSIWDHLKKVEDSGGFGMVLRKNVPYEHTARKLSDAVVHVMANDKLDWWYKTIAEKGREKK